MDTSTVEFQSGVALVVVDMQHDFAGPAGSLFVAGGDAIVEPIIELMRRARDAGATVGRRRTGTRRQRRTSTPAAVRGRCTAWPARGCRAGRRHRPPCRCRRAQGHAHEDGYSAFSMRDPVTGVDMPTGLAGLLQRGVDTVVVVGLAADVCVAATALRCRRRRLHHDSALGADRGRLSRSRPDVLAELETAGIAVVT